MAACPSLLRCTGFAACRRAHPLFGLPAMATARGTRIGTRCSSSTPSLSESSVSAATVAATARGCSRLAAPPLIASGPTQRWRRRRGNPSRSALGLAGAPLTNLVQTSRANVARLSSSSSGPTRADPASEGSASPSSSSSSSSSSFPSSSDVLASYTAPLARTFVRLKTFSLLSLGLAHLISPVLLFGPGEVGIGSRLALCAVALGTSGVSTALIAWIGAPYVLEMRLLSPSPSPASADDAGAKPTAPSSSSPNTDTRAPPPPPPPQSPPLRGAPMLELRTKDWRLRDRLTYVHDASLIRGGAQRPFANWELVAPDAHLAAVGGAGGAEAPRTRLLCRTVDGRTGAELGRWTLEATTSSTRGKRGDGDEEGGSGADGAGLGRVRREGEVARHFQVHEELLGDEWRIL